ncbi:MAG: glycosyltransferase family 2 protein [Planctomycetota bacterium]
MTTLELIWWCVAGPILFWWVLLAFGSAMQARKFAKLFEREPRQAFAEFRPPAAIIVPCKGADPQLADNLAAILRQNYPAPYRLVLVAQSPDDPAVPIIESAIAAAANDPAAAPAELLISGDAPPNQGQKVHNQLIALRHLGLDQLAKPETQVEAKQSAASDTPTTNNAPLTPDTALVFADSDAVPGPDWLANLIGPLKQQDKTAVTTGYRWLVPPPPHAAAEPLPGGEAAGIAQPHARPPHDPHPKITAIASVMNSSVLSFAGTGKFNFAWGGSMAMLARTAVEGDLLGMFDGALCDDYQVTRMARKINKRVYFVHRCIVASPDAWSYPGLRDFAYRQYMLTRKYFPGLYLLALAMLWAYPVGYAIVLASPLLIYVDAIGGLPGILAGVSLVAVWCFDEIRHRHRLIAMSHALAAEVGERMKPVQKTDRSATLVWMTLHAYLATRPLFSNVMTWRGITYRLHGPQRCERTTP